jgi:hypothetical protein
VVGVSRTVALTAIVGRAISLEAQRAAILEWGSRPRAASGSASK